MENLIEPGRLDAMARPGPTEHKTPQPIAQTHSQADAYCHSRSSTSSGKGAATTSGTKGKKRRRGRPWGTTLGLAKEADGYLTDDPETTVDYLVLPHTYKAARSEDKKKVREYEVPSDWVAHIGMGRPYCEPWDWEAKREKDGLVVVKEEPDQEVTSSATREKEGLVGVRDESNQEVTSSSDKDASQVLAPNEEVALGKGGPVMANDEPDQEVTSSNDPSDPESAYNEESQVSATDKTVAEQVPQYDVMHVKPRGPGWVAAWPCQHTILHQEICHRFGGCHLGRTYQHPMGGISLCMELLFGWYDDGLSIDFYPLPENVNRYVELWFSTYVGDTEFRCALSVLPVHIKAMGVSTVAYIRCSEGADRNPSDLIGAAEAALETFSTQPANVIAAEKNGVDLDNIKSWTIVKLCDSGYEEDVRRMKETNTAKDKATKLATAEAGPK